MTSEMQIVQAQTTRCPSCGSEKLKTYKSLPPDPEGAVRRYTQCTVCARKFFVIGQRRRRST